MANWAVLCLKLPHFVAWGEKKGADVTNEEVRWNFDHFSDAIWRVQLLPLEPSKLLTVGFFVPCVRSQVVQSTKIRHKGSRTCGAPWNRNLLRSRGWEKICPKGLKTLIYSALHFHPNVRGDASPDLPHGRE